MSKKKYKVEVTRIDVFEVEIDEAIWNKEELESFSKTFWEVKDSKMLAEKIAVEISRDGSDSEYFEGFGCIQMLNYNGSKRTCFSGSTILSEDEVTKGIQVRIVSEGEDIDTFTNLVN